MKFSAVCLFAVLWCAIVYIPIAHSVWFNPGPNDLATANDAALARSGFGFQMGALDFAGGTSLVHINAGIAGFVGCSPARPPHRLRQGGHASPFADADHGRRLAALGRLVRFKHGLQPQVQQPPHARNRRTPSSATAAAGLSCGFSSSGFSKASRASSAYAYGADHESRGRDACFRLRRPDGRSHPRALRRCAIFFFFCTAVKSALGYDDTLDVFGVHAIGGFIGGSRQRASWPRPSTAARASSLRRISFMRHVGLTR